jgi:glycosyltransferase involved in cell wall biosynthesis
MKILVVSQQYWPEYWRIVDMCEELVRRGNDVTVLCGLPNYDTGKVLSEYRRGSNRNQQHDGVKIIRCNEHPRRRNPFDLLLNYYSFPFHAKKVVKKLPDDFDVVLLNGLSPVMQSFPGLLYAKMHSCRCLMYCLDLWPASLAAGGIKNSGFTKPIFLHFLKVSKSVYKRCDRILVTSFGFIRYLSNVCGVPENRLSYLPQYAESQFGEPSKPLILNPDKLNFVFAGNVGKGQDIPTLIRAAKLLENSRIEINIVGDGSALSYCKKMAGDLSVSNVRFLGKLPFSSMPSLYAGADAMLVCLSNQEFASLVVPGKVQTYLAAGKPVVGACGDSVKSILLEAKCGFASESGNAESLAQCLSKMSSLSKNDLEKMGSNARKYAKEHFDRASFFDRLETELKALRKR